MSKKEKQLPVAFVFGNENKLKDHFNDPEIKKAFFSTRIAYPEKYLQPFPCLWEWSDVSCVIFTRLYGWDKDTIPTNSLNLAREALLRNTLIILHFDFESDVRNYGITLEPIFRMNL